MYPWKSTIAIDPQSSVAIYLQLVNAIVKEITAGRLVPGQKLPGTREMAALLSLNRKTIALAYDELMAQDWLDILPSRGAFVSQSLPLPRQNVIPVSGDPVQAVIPASANFSIPVLAPDSGREGVVEGAIRLTDGSPDVRLAPVSSLYRRCRRIATQYPRRKYLRYREVQGDQLLRETLKDYLQETRGLRCRTEQVMITRGSQMAIFLVLSLLLSPGETIVLGESHYPVVKELATRLGGKIVTVPVDEYGISVDALERLCKDHSIRVIYLTPHHHYPTTVTLTAERRMKILALAAAYQFAILEDDYDYDFHYASSPLLPLAALDTEGSVIYVGSFTKCLAPGIRVGYLVGPDNVIRSLADARRMIDRQGDPVQERALAEMLLEGEIQGHLKKALKIYRQRRDRFCQLLTEKLGDLVYFKIPDGGMAVWVRFNQDINLEKLIRYCATYHILLEDARHWWDRHRAIRLGFASLNEKEMEEALEVIARGLA